MLGIYIDNLKLPWVPDIFRLAEKMDVVIFTNNFTEFDVFNKVSVLASHHIWSFKDPIIAGDTFSARYLSGCPIQRKLFYINHIDWATNAFNAIDVIKASSLELITEPHLKDIVKSVWREPKVVKGWSYEGIQRVLNS